MASSGIVSEKLSLATQLLGFSACLVMSLGFVMPVIGLTGMWGRAKADALGGVVTGVADFTLWDMTIRSQIQPVQISLTDSKVNIDETLCQGGLHQINEVAEVCQTFHMARAFTWTALFVSVSAALSSWAAFGWSLGGLSSKTVTTSLLLFAALLSLHAFIFSISAMATMATSGNAQFEIENSLGPGVICMIVLVMSSLLSMILAIGYHVRIAHEIDDLVKRQDRDEVAPNPESMHV